MTACSGLLLVSVCLYPTQVAMRKYLRLGGYLMKGFALSQLCWQLTPASGLSQHGGNAGGEQVKCCRGMHGELLFPVLVLIGTYPVSRDLTYYVRSVLFHSEGGALWPPCYRCTTFSMARPGTTLPAYKRWRLATSTPQRCV